MKNRFLILAGALAFAALFAGCDLEDDDEEEQTYTVYTATTTISEYNAKLAEILTADLTEESFIYHTKTDSYATNSALVKSSFTSWKTQSLTEAQIRTQLSGLGIKSEYIDSFINNAAYGFAVGQSDGSAYLFFRFSGTTSTNTNSNSSGSTKIGAKSAPNAVGDIVFSDGSATAYSSSLTLTAAQKAAAVAVIFYAGSSSDRLGARTLGVGLKTSRSDGISSLKWALPSANGYNLNISTIQCTATSSQGGSGQATKATYTGDTDGSDNWAALKAFLASHSTDDTGTTGNYPAWEGANDYGTTHGLTGTYASNWYLPTIAELGVLYLSLSTVNAAIQATGNAGLSGYYWSSSQHNYWGSQAWYFSFNWGRFGGVEKNSVSYDMTLDIAACAIRAF